LALFSTNDHVEGLVLLAIPVYLDVAASLPSAPRTHTHAGDTHDRESQRRDTEDRETDADDDRETDVDHLETDAHDDRETDALHLSALDNCQVSPPPRPPLRPLPSSPSLLPPPPPLFVSHFPRHLPPSYYLPQTQNTHDYTPTPHHM